jgi:hypothetical protein
MSVETSDRKGNRTASSRSKHSTAVHASHAVQPSSFSASQSLSAVHADHAVQESSAKSVRSLQEAVKIALSNGIGENCCWNYARAIKAFERSNGKLPKKELQSAFNLWWCQAHSQLPEGADFHEYFGDFLCCYEKALVPLGQNALNNAIAAALDGVREADVSRFGQRAAKLLALARQLQRLSGEKPFFLAQRDVGKVIGSKDPWAPKKAIALLVSQEVLTIIAKGTYAGHKATSYRLNDASLETPLQTDTEFPTPVFESDADPR